MRQLHSVVEAINAAGLDPSAWQSALDAMSSVVGGMRAHMISVDPSHPVPVRTVVSGYDPGYLKTYDAHYASMNAWAPAFIREPVGVVVPVEQMLPHDALQRTEFYNDWIRPQDDVSAGGGMILTRGVDRILLLGANIPQRQAAQGQKAWLEALPLLGAAVRHAVQVNQTLFGLRLDLFLAQINGDGPGSAVFLLGEQDRLIHANAQAMALIRSGSLLRQGLDRRLRFVDAQVQARFDQAAQSRSAVQMTLGKPGNLCARTVPLTEAAAQALNLAPIFGNLRPVRVVIITAPPKPVDTAPVLRQIFGLTEAEIDLSLHLADGLTLAAIAEHRRVSIHTVRNQIKSALEKTGLHRQADLVGLVERSRKG